MNKINTYTKIVKTKKSIIFHINENEYLRFFLATRLEEMPRWFPVKITYYNKNEKIVIFKDFFNEALVSLKSSLEELLNGNLQLHSSINQDIGLIWSRYLQDDIEVDYYISEDVYKRWVGLKYLLWCSKNITTWLYQKKDKLIFEITHSYRGYLSGSVYEEFIRTYKPFVITEISKEIALEWLKEVESLLVMATNNDAKYITHE